jgi:type IV pilus assembly protein PilC
MPVFRYNARSETGVDSAGVLLAPNEEVLYQILRGQGLFLLSSREHHGRSLSHERLRISPKQLLVFTIHIATFQESGIPLVQALRALAQESASLKFHTMIEGLINRISGGTTFSEALAQYPKIFDQHYVQMVATGEASGQLDARLIELVTYLEWRQEIRSQVKQSSTYPLVITGLLFLVITLLMTFTLPKFITLLEGFNVPLPLPTRIVIALSDIFSNYWFLLPVLPAVPYLFYWIMKRTQQGRLTLDRWKLKLPLFGSLQKKIALSRFAHHFSSLHVAGIDTPEALRIVEELVGNLAISTVIQWIRHEVSTGKSLSQLLSRSGEFPSFVVQMFAAGEESGNMEGTLKKVSQYYDREIPIAIKRAFTLIEPLILVLMGGLVLFIALSVLLPIYEFGTSINH